MTDEIVHHGIIGMKWGVRRTPEQLGHKTSGEKNKADSRVDPSSMSDEDLDKALNRLRKETEFKRLSAPPQQPQQPNQNNQKSFGSKVLEEVGKKAVVAAITAGIVVAGNRYIAKSETSIGPPTASQAVIRDLVKEAITRFGR